MATTPTSTSKDIDRPTEAPGYYLIGEDYNRRDHLYRPHKNDVLIVTPAGIETRLDLAFLGKNVVQYKNWWAKRCGWHVVADIRDTYNYVGTTTSPDGRTLDHIFRIRDQTIHIINRDGDDGVPVREEIASISEGKSIHDYVAFVEDETDHGWTKLMYSRESTSFVNRSRPPA